MDMRSVTLEVVYANSTHEFTPVTQVHLGNPLAKSVWICWKALGVLWYNSSYEFGIQ